MNNASSIRSQNGLVMVIAMIALVILSLAAVALIRTVDSAALIAGNLTFKQAATNSGEAALVKANQWLATAAAVDPPIGLDTNNQAVGYYSTVTGLTTSLTDDATWASGVSQAASVKCGSVISDKDCSGNTIRYVIERMCTKNGATSGSLAPVGQECLVGPATESGDSHNVVDGNIGMGPATAGNASPMFRITARSVGPKNTVSYIQTFVY